MNIRKRLRNFVLNDGEGESIVECNNAPHPNTSEPPTPQPTKFKNRGEGSLQR